MARQHSLKDRDNNTFASSEYQFLHLVIMHYMYDSGEYNNNYCEYPTPTKSYQSDLQPVHCKQPTFRPRKQRTDLIQPHMPRFLAYNFKVI